MKSNLLLIILILITIFSLSFASALSFEGSKKTFEYFGKDTTVLTKEHNCVEINPNWETLKKETGILGMILHLSMPQNDKTFLVVKDPTDNPIRHKSIVGVNIAFKYTYEDLQNNLLFVSLEDIKSYEQGTIKICGYTNSESNITVYKDSELGIYKIPYFECKESFSKTPTVSQYKVGQKTPIEIKFKNCGYADANLSVFWDNELFTKWFKLNEGDPSWTGILESDKESTISYMFTPLIAENFIISPAFLHYTTDGYKFTTYSNPVIVGTVPYLDTVNCELFISKHNYSIGEEADIEIALYNDSMRGKDFELVLEKKDQTEKKHIIIPAQESASELFAISENEEAISDLEIYLLKEDQNLRKLCGTDSIGFTRETNNYLPYAILLLILISIGTIVYYYYLM